MSSEPQLPQIGDLVDNGKYRIERKIGEGAMGAVYAATHTVLGNRVAIKWLLPKLAGNETAVKRFLSEAKIAARVEHPNVVRPIDVSTETGAPYIVMELLEGESLSDFLQDGRLSVEKTGRVMGPVLRAVAAAHEKGVVHRDLKLANIFLAKTAVGRVPKVLDFGIAKVTEAGDTSSTLTQEGSTMGTVLYMSPEQLKDPRNVTVQTDVYALGVVLYRLLTGKLPFEGSILDLALRIHEGNPTPMTEHVKDLPAELNAVVMRAIARSLEERYRDVASLALALAPHFPDQQLDWQPNQRTSMLGLESPIKDEAGKRTLSSFPPPDPVFTPQPKASRGEPLEKTLADPAAQAEVQTGSPADSVSEKPAPEPQSKPGIEEPSTLEPVNVPSRRTRSNRGPLLVLAAVLLGGVFIAVGTLDFSEGTEESGSTTVANEPPPVEETSPQSGALDIIGSKSNTAAQADAAVAEKIGRSRDEKVRKVPPADSRSGDESDTASRRRKSKDLKSAAKPRVRPERSRSRRQGPSQPTESSSPDTKERILDSVLGDDDGDTEPEKKTSLDTILGS